jgi:hypothetical protein
MMDFEILNTGSSFLCVNSVHDKHQTWYCGRFKHQEKSTPHLCWALDTKLVKQVLGSIPNIYMMVNISTVITWKSRLEDRVGKHWVQKQRRNSSLQLEVVIKVEAVHRAIGPHYKSWVWE